VEEMKVPHLLVIGGTGFIGHHLLKSVQQKGWRITSVSLNPPTKDRFVKNVTYINFDLAVRDLVKKHITEDFDYVVNLGGYINHQLFKEGGRDLINTHFTALQNLIEMLSRRRLKRFVQIGSSDEYGNAQAPQQVELREQPISPYSLAKVACSHFLQMIHRTENFPAVILRLFLTYGPGQDNGRFLPQIIRGCLNDDTFPTSAGEQIRDFCYVDDTVRAILQALAVPKANGHIFNVASGIPVSIRTMIEKICVLTGRGNPQYGKIPYRPSENMALYANLSKEKDILQWEPNISLEEGLKKTIDYFANENA
jgi:nucleoside-diphosphate-sugar epimerase